MAPPAVSPKGMDVHVRGVVSRDLGLGLFPFSSGMNFLGNVLFGRDLYDLTRSWTKLSIGEPTCVGNVVVNDTSRRVLKLSA